jgi:O-antigen ligase
MIFRGIWIIGLLALVVLSWSRATWLAGAICLLLLGWLRLPKRWIFLPLVLLVAAIAMINLNANRESWERNEYLWRLSSLVRIENLEAKDPDRIHLYQKALAMIREHPLIGHGIGSFYLNSEHYARPGDPYATLPDFTHNFLLQMAAELGVPVTALFAVLIVFALCGGFRKWKVESGSHDGKTVRQSNGQPVDGSTVGRYHGEDGLTILGVTMALGAYLITQMTANALNIYVSNQFFFWFLMTAVLSVVDFRKEAQEVAKEAVK